MYVNNKREQVVKEREGNVERIGEYIRIRVEKSK